MRKDKELSSDYELDRISDQAERKQNDCSHRMESRSEYAVRLVAGGRGCGSRGGRLLSRRIGVCAARGHGAAGGSGALLIRTRLEYRGSAKKQRQSESWSESW